MLTTADRRLARSPSGSSGLSRYRASVTEKPEDGVAQEFQPLVGGDATVFVGVGAVCERKTKRPGVNSDTETLQKLFS